MMDRPGDYEMVMPFVCTTSSGGPYDDLSFVAGCRFGDLSRLVRMLPPEVDEWHHVEYVALLPQIDLFAMSEGWSVARDEGDEDEAWADEWACITLKRIPAAGLMP